MNTHAIWSKVILIAHKNIGTQFCTDYRIIPSVLNLDNVRRFSSSVSQINSEVGNVDDLL